MSYTIEKVVVDGGELVEKKVTEIEEAKPFIHPPEVVTFTGVFSDTLRKSPGTSNNNLIGKAGEPANLIFVKDKVVITNKKNETYVRSVVDVLGCIDLNSLSVDVKFVTHKRRTIGMGEVLCFLLGKKQTGGNVHSLCFKEGLLPRYNNGEFLQEMLGKWLDSMFNLALGHYPPVSNSLCTYLNMMKDVFDQLVYQQGIKQMLCFFQRLSTLYHSLSPALQEYYKLVYELYGKGFLQDDFLYPFNFWYYPQNPMTPQEAIEWYLSFSQNFTTKLRETLPLLKSYRDVLEKQCRQGLRPQILQFNFQAIQTQGPMVFLFVFEKALAQVLQPQQAPRPQEAQGGFHDGAAGLQDF